MFAIVKIEKYKDRKLIKELESHNERLNSPRQRNANINALKTYANYHLIRPTKSYMDTIQDRILIANIKRLRRDSVILQEGLITASPDFFKVSSSDEINRYFNYTLQFFINRYGRDNFITAVVHMDEEIPHMHFDFVPITSDNRLSSKEIIGGPHGLSKLQDAFFEYMVCEYPNFEREAPSVCRSHKVDDKPYKIYNMKV